MPKLIDSHTHTNFNIFKNDGTEVIRRCLANDIWLINVGSQYSTSERAFNIAIKYPQGVYSAIGLHPVHLFKTEIDEEEIKFNTHEEEFDVKKYQALIDLDYKNSGHNKIVAIGEIGLDYYHLPTGHSLTEVKTRQSQEFIKQLKFATKNNLPVIIHCRGSVNNPYQAYDDIYDILNQQIKLGLKLRGVIHCYGGNLAQAKKFIALGFYIGFTGIITFGRNADDLRNIAKKLPLNKILIETDAPYLTPVPYRGQRNEPAYVEYVAYKIAEIKNIPFIEVAEQTVNNTKELFKI